MRRKGGGGGKGIAHLRPGVVVQLVEEQVIGLECLLVEPDDAGRARDFSALQGKNPQQYLVYCKDFSRR